MDGGASFVVVLHQVWKKHPLHQDFLGLYVMDSHKLSEQTHGLLGMNYHGAFLLFGLFWALYLFIIVIICEYIFTYTVIQSCVSLYAHSSD